MAPGFADQNGMCLVPTAPISEWLVDSSGGFDRCCRVGSDGAFRARMAWVNVVVGSRVNMSDVAQDLGARAVHAALTCRGIRHPSVILVDADAADGTELRQVLRSMGLDVFHGPYGAGIIGRPLLMLCAGNRGRRDVGVRLDLARRAFPSAPVCVVTGLLPEVSSIADDCGGPFDDARALLQVAGIGFLSTVEVCDDTAPHDDDSSDRDGACGPRHAMPRRMTGEPAEGYDIFGTSDCPPSRVTQETDAGWLGQARVLMLGFPPEHLVDLREGLRSLGVRVTAASPSVRQLSNLAENSMGFSHILVNFGAFEDLEAGVDALAAFRAGAPEIVVIACSTRRHADDIVSARGRHCDATLRLPVSTPRLRDGLLAATVSGQDERGSAWRRPPLDEHDPLGGRPSGGTDVPW